jgi:hypothetical protein
MPKLNNGYYFEAGDRLIAISDMIELLIERHSIFDTDMYFRMTMWFIKDAISIMAIEVGKSIVNPNEHAAKDRSLWMFEMVDKLLLEEQAIEQDPKAKMLAQAAADNLWKLFQHLGAKT